MVRKLCAWLLAFSLCLPAIPAAAVADDEAALLYLDIRPFSQSAVTRCPVLVKDQRIYLSAEDLAWAAEYGLEWWDKDALFFTRDSSLLDVGVFLDADETVAMAMGREFDLPAIEHEGTVFLDMEKTLYLLHAQWCVKQEQLV